MTVRAPLPARQLEAAALLAACVVLAIWAGVSPGQDAGWDLRNYHFYNPYALLHGRGDLDVAPAQLQSWLSPYWDVVLYALVRSGWSSSLTTALLSLPAGAGLFLLGAIAARLAPPHARRVTAVTAVAIGATGAIGLSTIGTAYSEWHLTALMLAAIWLALSAEDEPRRDLLPFALAGACAGAATGLKLSFAPYALGLGVMVLLLRAPPRRRLPRAAALGAGGVALFLACYGPWAWTLARRTGNPFFPFWNDLFRSPLLPPLSYQLRQYVPDGLVALVTLPARIARLNNFVVGEIPLRDPRLLVGFAALAFLAWGPRGADTAVRRRWRAILAFFVLSYLLWARAFGILRFAVPLEALSAVGAAAAVAWLLPRRAGWQLAGAVALAAALIASTVRPGWERAPHGSQAVVARVPPLPANAMVVIATFEPVAYVVPSLPAAVPVLSLVDNFEAFGPYPALQRAAFERVRSHDGPLLLLAKGDPATEPFAGGTVATALAGMGLRPDLAHPAPIHDGLGTGALALYPLARFEPARPPP